MFIQMALQSPFSANVLKIRFTNLEVVPNPIVRIRLSPLPFQLVNVIVISSF